MARWILRAALIVSLLASGRAFASCEEAALKLSFEDLRYELQRNQVPNDRLLRFGIPSPREINAVAQDLDLPRDEWLFQTRRGTGLVKIGAEYTAVTEVDGKRSLSLIKILDEQITQSGALRIRGEIQKSSEQGGVRWEPFDLPISHFRELHHGNGLYSLTYGEGNPIANHRHLNSLENPELIRGVRSRGLDPATDPPVLVDAGIALGQEVSLLTQGGLYLSGVFRGVDRMTGQIHFSQGLVPRGILRQPTVALKGNWNILSHLESETREKIFKIVNRASDWFELGFGGVSHWVRYSRWDPNQGMIFKDLGNQEILLPIQWIKLGKFEADYTREFAPEPLDLSALRLKRVCEGCDFVLRPTKKVRSSPLEIRHYRGDPDKIEASTYSIRDEGSQYPTDRLTVVIHRFSIYPHEELEAFVIDSTLQSKPVITRRLLKQSEVASLNAPRPSDLDAAKKMVQVTSQSQEISPVKHLLEDRPRPLLDRRELSRHLQEGDLIYLSENPIYKDWVFEGVTLHPNAKEFSNAQPTLSGPHLVLRSVRNPRRRIVIDREAAYEVIPSRGTNGALISQLLESQNTGKAIRVELNTQGGWGKYSGYVNRIIAHPPNGALELDVGSDIRIIPLDHIREFQEFERPPSITISISKAAQEELRLIYQIEDGKITLLGQTYDLRADSQYVQYRIADRLYYARLLAPFSNQHGFHFRAQSPTGAVYELSPIALASLKPSEKAKNRFFEEPAAGPAAPYAVASSLRKKLRQSLMPEMQRIPSRDYFRRSAEHSSNEIPPQPVEQLNEVIDEIIRQSRKKNSQLYRFKFTVNPLGQVSLQWGQSLPSGESKALVGRASLKMTNRHPPRYELTYGFRDSDFEELNLQPEGLAQVKNATQSVLNELFLRPKPQGLGPRAKLEFIHSDP